ASFRIAFGVKPIEQSFSHCYLETIQSNNNLIIQGSRSNSWEQQVKFRIQQYLPNEHYALWEVIKFGDSYQAPPEESGTGSASKSSAKKKGRTVAITTKDMQKRRNDVKARTTLLLALPDEHQLRFSKLQAIVSHLEFMDVEIEQDDLNQKFLTSLAPEWLMYTIVWRNRDDPDTLSLDDVYNHLKVYEPEVQKKSKSNSQNMAFISSANTSSGKGKINTASVPTASTQVSPASPGVVVASISHDTIDKHDIKEMDIKWNMALLSMRADRFWKKTGKKITIQGTDVAGFDKSKVEYFNCHKMGHFARECRAPKSQDRGLSQVEARLVKFKTQEIKFCEKIRGLEFDVESKNNKIEHLMNELEQVKKEKEGLDSKLTGFESASKDLDTYLGSQRTDKNREGLRYSIVPPSCSKSIMSKPMIKFVKASDNPKIIKTNKVETARKPPVRYPEMYRNTSKSPNGNSQNNIDDKGYWDSGCSRHMTGNISYLSDYEPYDEGYVSFGQGGGKITGKGIIKAASADESMLWHRRLGHLNFKTMNKLVRHNLVKCLPSKCYENDHTCVACLKGKHHKASCKTKLVNSVSKPLHTLHMDLFGPTSVNSLNHKWYCLVVTDDFSRFTWTFFLKTMDETSGILRNFITEIENLKVLKMKIIRCDNRGEFKNKEMNEFCTRKGIKREFSNARTPQQNRVTERRNRTLIEAGKTMIADAKLPVTFWAEAVNTACYVQNRVLVNKSHNKTSYELLNSRTPAIGFLKPFGCHVMILNTLDHLGKFDAKRDEGYFIGYSMSSKAFRVFNKRTKKVEENLHVDFLENKLIEKGAGPNWLFDIDTLTNSMNYVPVVVAGTSSTNFLGTKDVASQDVKKDVSSLRYIALPNWFHESHLESSTSNAQDTCNAAALESSGNSNPTATSKNPPADQMETLTVEYAIPTVSSPVLTACLDDSPETLSDIRLISKRVTSQDETPSLDNILTLSNRFEDILGVTTNTVDTNGVEDDLSNMESIIPASPTPTFRIHKDHSKSQIIGPVDTHEEPKKIFDALKDPRVRPIGTKWVLKNKKDERGIVIRNKAMLVAQGHTQEEGINYEEVFAQVARIEAIRLFLAYASFIGFAVYQMDVKSAFLYGTIDEKVYVMQPPGFQDPQFPDRVYKVEKAMYGLHQALRAWYGTLSKYLLANDFQRGTIDQTLFIRKHRGDFLLVQVSMIGSLTYLTASRPDIMFAVHSCARHQVTPKECHLHAVKRIFRYLKGHPKLGLWYPKDSPFDLVAYSDSDYGEGSMQQQLQELTDLYTRLQRQQTELATKIEAQDLGISSFKERVKLLEDKDKGSAELSRDDAPIKGRSME
nr:hypothetical protein [Tanacetum cinerariifolium]